MVETLTNRQLNQCLPNNLQETPRDELVRYARRFIAQETKQKGSGQLYSGPHLKLFNQLDLLSSQGKFAHPALPYMIVQQVPQSSYELVDVGGYGPVKQHDFRELAKILKTLASELTPGQSVLDSAIAELYMLALMVTDPSHLDVQDYKYQGKYLRRFNELQLMDLQGNWAHSAIPYIIKRLVNPENQYQLSS
jgi:hypothetical protein